MEEKEGGGKGGTWWGGEGERNEYNIGRGGEEWRVGEGTDGGKRQWKGITTKRQHINARRGVVNDNPNYIPVTQAIYSCNPNNMQQLLLNYMRLYILVAAASCNVLLHFTSCH